MAVASGVTREESHRRCAAVVLCANIVVRREMVLALEDEPPAFCHHVTEVMPALKLTAAPLLITEPADVDGEFSIEVVARIAIQAPRLRVVVLKRASDVGSRALLGLTDFGIADVVATDAPHFAERLHAIARQARVFDRVVECGQRLSEGLPADAGRLVRHVFRRASNCVSVADICGTTGLNQRKVERRLQVAGLTGRTLLARRRVIAGTVMNESTLLTVERVAHEAGYASVQPFRVAIRKYTGMSREDLIANGGSEFLVRTLRENLISLTS